MRALWNFIAGLKLTSWLLAGIFMTLVAGGCACLYDYAFFNTMNGTPVQEWFLAKGVTRPLLTWWIPLLFALFTALGGNIVACAADRAMQILKNRKGVSPSALFVQVIPTLVHVLFVVVLFGHFVTFTTGRQDRIPITIGATADLPGGGTIEFIDIKNVFYPDNTMLRGRKSQTYLTARIGSGPKFTLAFADFVMIDGRAFHLDMDMRMGRKARIETAPPVKETCNQSDAFKKIRGEPLKLQVTRDPGLWVTLGGLTAIILLMSWFFIQVYARKKTAR